MMSEQLSTPAPAEPRKVFHVTETMWHDDQYGYVPSVAVEGESGFTPLTGNGVGAAPWSVGHDIATARKLVAGWNEELGHSAEDVERIVRAAIMAGDGREPRGS